MKLRMIAFLSATALAVGLGGARAGGQSAADTVEAHVMATDVAISNHAIDDGSKTKLPALAKRKAGDPHPYVIGNVAVQRYLTVVAECTKAALTALNR